MADYCFQTYYGDYSQYNGSYFSAGTYDGFDYFTGNGVTLGYVFYNTGTTSWCLSTSLGGSCLFFGKSPCVSTTPDLCGELFFSDICPTPTPTPTTNCLTFTFEAVFECDIPLTPTTTSTPTPTPTPTVTPSPSDVCSTSLAGFSFTFIQESPTPTPTPTVTPSFGPIQRDCSFSGSVTYNTINDTIFCPQTSQFRDCDTGQMYYTSDNVGSSVDILADRIYNATINGTVRCVSYVGASTNGGIDTIVINDGPYGSYSNGDCSLGCSGVVPTSSPTPTPTITPTITPTSGLFTSSVCFTVKQNFTSGPNYFCQLTHVGVINGKPYYYLTASDCSTPVSIVYWNNTTNRWENATPSLVAFQYCANPSTYPESNTTYPWVNIIPASSINYQIVGSTTAGCPSPTPTPTNTSTPTPTSVSSMFRIQLGDKSCSGGVCNFPIPGVDQNVYVSVGYTPETAPYIYTDAALTTLLVTQYFKYANKIYSVSGGIPSFVCIVGSPC